MSRRAGFTLLEVLVAVVIVTISITAFFQLLGGSLKLEKRGADKIELMDLAVDTFEWLLDQDLLDEEFPWEGSIEGRTFRLELHPVQVKPDTEDKDPWEEDAINIALPDELYALVFTMREGEEGGSVVVLKKLLRFSPGHFSDEFKELRLTAAPPESEPVL